MPAENGSEQRDRHCKQKKQVGIHGSANPANDELLDWESIEICTVGKVAKACKVMQPDPRMKCKPEGQVCASDRKTYLPAEGQKTGNGQNAERDDSPRCAVAYAVAIQIKNNAGQIHRYQRASQQHSLPEITMAENMVPERAARRPNLHKQRDGQHQDQRSAKEGLDQMALAKKSHHAEQGDGNVAAELVRDAPDGTVEGTGRVSGKSMVVAKFLQAQRAAQEVHHPRNEMLIRGCSSCQWRNDQRTNQHAGKESRIDASYPLPEVVPDRPRSEEAIRNEESADDEEGIHGDHSSGALAVCEPDHRLQMFRAISQRKAMRENHKDGQR